MIRQGEGRREEDDGRQEPVHLEDLIFARVTGRRANLDFDADRRRQ
jgi:hypothetical protein